MSARLLIAPYAFKGTLTASAAATAMVHAVRRARPAWRVASLPLADGGRGTMAAVAEARGGMWHTVPSCNALGEPIAARWLDLGDGRAVFEAAECVALAEVPPGRRDPFALTTRGIGMVIQAMLDAGVRRLFLGLGDTATHDGGMGLAAELGARFRDAQGRELAPIGRSLAQVAEIDTEGLARRLGMLSVTAWCDVLNPLLGHDGAARRFAAQKGATADQIEAAEEGGHAYAAALSQLMPDVVDVPGAGAAGGIGAGLAAMLGAQLAGGADAVLDAVEFERRARDVDAVLTGEGSIDAQTFLGKGVSRLALRASRLERAVVAFAGVVVGRPTEIERQLGARVIALREGSGVRADLPNSNEAAAELAAAVAVWVESTRQRSG